MTVAKLQDIKLNVGSGGVELPGFRPIDRALGQEAYPLHYPTNSVAHIRASHILEHFGFQEVPKVLKEWVRVLRPGGVIEIAVPDFRKAIDIGAGGDPLWANYIMGGQIDENDYHKSLFDEQILTAFMERAGLVDIESWDGDKADTSQLAVSLNLKGMKPFVEDDGYSQDAGIFTTTPTYMPDGLVTPSAPQEYKIPKTVAVMSAPRLGFIENMLCSTTIFNRFKIPNIVHMGAFWEQCLERSIMDAIEKEADWIVTMDYDTVFTEIDFARLLKLFCENPHIDALAPLQMKREEDLPLLWGKNEDGSVKREWTLDEFEPELVRVHHAHFGLTLFRVEALQRMPHPWFWGRPNNDGYWKDGRTDPDIAFWEKWQQFGNSLYVAAHVPIGHLQLMASWPNQELSPLHQFIGDFNRNGKPEGART